MSNIAAWFGESLKSGSGILPAADYSGIPPATQFAGTQGSAQFLAVTINSSGLAVLVSAQGVGQVKVLLNKPKVGDPCQLNDIGECKLIAGAAVAIGALLMTDSSGRFITYVNNGVNVPVGEARMAASVAGDVFTGMIWPTPAVGGSAQGAILDSIVALSGGGRPGAPVLVNGWNRIITAVTGDSVVLPPAAAGMEIVLINDGAGNAQVFGNGSDTIDGTAGATGVVLTAAKRGLIFCLTAPRWQSVAALKFT